MRSSSAKRLALASAFILVFVHLGLSAGDDCQAGGADCSQDEVSQQRYTSQANEFADSSSGSNEAERYQESEDSQTVLGSHHSEDTVLGKGKAFDSESEADDSNGKQDEAEDAIDVIESAMNEPDKGKENDNDIFDEDDRDGDRQDVEADEGEEIEDDDDDDNNDDVDDDDGALLAVALDMRRRRKLGTRLPAFSFNESLQRALSNAKSTTGSSKHELHSTVDPDTDDILVVCSCIDERNSGLVTALSVETGQPFWTLELPAKIVAEPVHSVDQELVFVSTLGWHVYAVSCRDGIIVWEFSNSDAAFMARPLVGLRSLYLANVKGNVYAMNAETGTVMWTQNVGSGAATGGIVHALADDNKPVVMVTSTHHSSSDVNGTENDVIENVFCLFADNGRVKWSSHVEGAIMHSPYLIGDSVFVIGTLTASNASMLYGYDASNGSVLWSRKICSNSSYSPGILPNTDEEHFLAVCSQGVIYGVETETGELATQASLQKRIHQPVEIIAPPSLRHDMVFFIATTNGLVLNFGISTGRMNPVQLLPEPIVAAPIKGPYGDLYTVTYGGHVLSQELSDAAPTWTANVEGHILVSPLYV